MTAKEQSHRGAELERKGDTELNQLQQMIYVRANAPPNGTRVLYSYSYHD